MSAAEIPDAVQKFIAQNLESAELLETLLLMHSQPGREWAPDDVARAIYTVPAGATRRLEQLVALGLASTNGASSPRYRYTPANPRLRDDVDALASTYREHRVAVVNLIYGQARDPAQSFADAFRLRKD